MKRTILVLGLVLTIIFTYGQKYTTTGIIQYQKLDGHNFKKTLALPSFAATWSVYTDDKLVKVLEGDLVVCAIKKKIKNGNQTTYILNAFVEEIKVIIEEGISVTTIEGANEEIKSVYKITKTEKTNGVYGDNY